MVGRHIDTGRMISRERTKESEAREPGKSLRNMS